MTDIVKQAREHVEEIGLGRTANWITDLADEIERLREALQFYTCGCKEDRCTPDKQRFRDIKCGWVAREALEGK